MKREYNANCGDCKFRTDIKDLRLGHVLPFCTIKNCIPKSCYEGVYYLDESRREDDYFKWRAMCCNKYEQKAKRKVLSPI